MLYSCPFCYQDNSIPYRNNERLRSGISREVRQCKNCAIAYPYPRMAPKEAVSYIPSLVNFKDIENNCVTTDLRKRGNVLLNWSRAFSAPAGYYGNLISYLKKRIEIEGNALDIGAYGGGFCSHLETLGFSAFGLEPSAEAAASGRKNGLSIFHGSFPEEIPESLLKMRFSFISVMETLYYFCDLKKGLKIIYDMLTPNGSLFIKCHQLNSNYHKSTNASLFKRYGDWVQHFPSKNSLLNCLEKSGFKVIHISYSESDNTLPIKLNIFANSGGLPNRLFLIFAGFINGVHAGIMRRRGISDQIMIIAKRGEHV